MLGGLRLVAVAALVAVSCGEANRNPRDQGEGGSSFGGAAESGGALASGGRVAASGGSSGGSTPSAGEPGSAGAPDGAGGSVDGGAGGIGGAHEGGAGGTGPVCEPWACVEYTGRAVHVGEWAPENFSHKDGDVVSYEGADWLCVNGGACRNLAPDAPASTSTWMLLQDGCIPCNQPWIAGRCYSVGQLIWAPLEIPQGPETAIHLFECLDSERCSVEFPGDSTAWRKSFLCR
jgi:hypothetical protein